ncbi:hypothetical protein, conserved [Eimeria necatrix]|uniref:Uncharacterized protein n=1 Tax=Eimeria necatrix TaxID=51315 RepID=U6MM28_9EIME|nr:hypothetical protein, conserved [Eimeria necatrix]CDJ65056.1 hypothetical protein, conserved [Eimeria necatrix]
MDISGDQVKKTPKVVVVPPSSRSATHGCSRPPEAQFADPATGAPIHGKMPPKGNSGPIEATSGASKLLDPADIEDVFERQDSRMPDICEDEQKNSNSK